MTVEDLLSESVEAARSRERTTFDDIVDLRRERVVLFGAGMLGRKVARSLIQKGVTPLGFIDHNPELQGKRIEGIPVFAPKAGVERWREDTLFIITIFHPTADKGMRSRIDFLRQLGCVHVIPFLPVAWALEGTLPHYAVDLPSRLLVHAADLRQVAALWSDRESAEVFRQQLMWRLRADFSELEEPAPDQYFPKDLVTPNNQEKFVDGGAYDGDTLRAIPWPIVRAWAIEPDPQNAAKLKTGIVDNHTTVHETALGSEKGATLFDAAGTMASTKSAQGNVEVGVSCLDDLLARDVPTFIKLDIEGDELLALKGGRRVLEASQAVLAVCVYHRPEDLWTIPVYLKQSLPNHEFALRAHAYDGFELVAYAIPQERWQGRGK